MLRAKPFDTHLIGRRVLSCDRVESTNVLAAAAHAGDPANDGLVIVAEEQTAGRGRHGRKWLCPRGDGLLLSVLLFPPEPLRRPALLTGLAAVAVCDTISECSRLEATIKWPNDVLIQGKKVCGILVEHGRGLVIGIGVNVNTPAAAFRDAGLDHAASLAMFTGREFVRESLFQTLVRRLDTYYHDLLAGQDGVLEARWRWHSGLIGRPVALTSQGRVHEGRILELAFAGIVLQETDGPHRFAPELVEHIVPVDS